MKSHYTLMRLTARLLSIIIIVSLLMTFTAVTVLADATISVSPGSGAPGTPVTVSGSDFGPSEVVTITFAGSTITTTTASVAGDIFCSFTVPTSTYGSHPVTAYGAVTTTPAETNFTTTKKVTWNKTSGPPGTTVTLTGSGFGAYDNITVRFEGETVLTDTASSIGYWSGSFEVPDSASGSHSVTVQGSMTGTSYESFTVTPKISLDKTSGAPGTEVTVSGSGFGDEEDGICITFDGDIVASGFTADEDGEWTGEFTVPGGASGSHKVGAYGDDNDEEDVPTVTFKIGAGITINKTSGAPGTSVTVTGSGFGNKETGICITFDGVTLASGISATTSGGWTGNFTVPAGAAGAHYVGAFGSKNDAENIAAITFTTTAAITITETSGAPGTAVTVTGAGFGASETGIGISFDGNPVASGITANATGGWSGNFIVPAAAAGPHNIGAYGSISAAGSVAGASLTVTATVSVGTATGVPGSSITVTGNGFGANETGISITIDNSQVVTGIIANPSGSWSAEVTIPPLAFGSHTISAGGLVTQASASSAVNFNITPFATISPATGHIGSAVTVTGSGFTANSIIRISYDSVDITTNATSDAGGNVSQQITIPASIAGTHTIAVADSQGNNVKTTFTISDTPPAAPAPLSPTDKSTIGLTGNITPTFKWSAVDDPNGVTYQLQIDTNSDFAYPVFNKNGIEANSYELRSYEALPRGTYYWRVKAVNNASVESAWSAPRTLNSGLFAPWMLALIIVLGVAAISLGVYFGIIRTLQRRREAITVSEVEMVPGQWQGLEAPEEPARERQAARRLALPEISRSSKTMATEDQARLKVIVEFAQSMPLAEPDYNINWIEGLVESQIHTELSVPVYEQLLKGEIQVRYEPSWMRHPIYKDLTVVLEKQPILNRLNTFISDIERCASGAISLIGQVYQDSKSEMPHDFLERGGWRYLTAVYTDALNWYAGKSLYDPAERDYRLEAPDGNKAATQRWLAGEVNTVIAGRLILAHDEKEAQQLRNLHLKLRRNWRDSEKARQIAAAITQLQLKRNELLNAFSQFGRMK